MANMFKVFQAVLDRAVARYDAMDHDEFVEAIRDLMRQDGMAGDIVISTALDSMTRRGSIDAAAALTIVSRNCCEEHRPKYAKKLEEAITALVLRSDDLRAGMNELPSMKRK